MTSLDLTDPEHVEMISALRSKYMPPIKCILDLLPGEIFNKISNRIEMLTCFDVKITPLIKINDINIFISFEQVRATHDMNVEIAKIRHLFNDQQWSVVLHNISSELNELRKTYAKSFESWFSDILSEDEVKYGRFPRCDKKNTTLYFGENCPMRLGIVLKIE